VHDLTNSITMAERRWPSLIFKHRMANNASSACPFCRDGYDRFVVFAAGNYWCRRCGVKGWIDKPDSSHKLTEAELLEIRVKALERKQREHERRLTALERMSRCTDHLAYHRTMDSDDWAYWHTQGMWDETIEKHKLGVCFSCPADRQHRPSWTIPVVNGDKLCNIRHRIIDAKDGDKYRPHLAGLGAMLFNADALEEASAECIMIVEGEKKSIVLSQYEYANVGLMGKRVFQRAWLEQFGRFREVMIALDPDAMDSAYRLARLFDGRARVASLPVKPDDFFILGGTVKEFDDYLKYARRVNSS